MVLVLEGEGVPNCDPGEILAPFFSIMRLFCRLCAPAPEFRAFIRIATGGGVGLYRQCDLLSMCQY